MGMEYSEWKTFSNALDKREKNLFDRLWDLTALYNSAMSNCVYPDTIKTIFISTISPI
jgi:hypothetical protein